VNVDVLPVVNDEASRRFLVKRGYAPSGIGAVLLMILIVLLFTGRL